jgi:COP9 signalosome complex subunit 4
MDSALASATAIADQRQKIEQYRHIIASVLSSSPPDISQAKRFLDHSNAPCSRTLTVDFTLVVV